MNENDQLKDFWAKYPDKLLETIFDIRLPFYQRVILRMMNLYERIKRKNIYCKCWMNCLVNDNWACGDCKYRRLFK